MAIKVYYYRGTMIAWFKITFIILSNVQEERGGCVRERRREDAAFLSNHFAMKRKG